MERVEKTGNLSKYMEDHVDWIESTFGRDNEGSVRRIFEVFFSLLIIPQVSILSGISYTCHGHREDRSLGYRHKHIVRSHRKCVVQHWLCWCRSMGRVVQKLTHFTHRTSPRHVFSPTDSTFLTLTVFYGITSYW